MVGGGARGFEGQTVVITGASLGVGRAAAHAFHAQGANVVMVARREAPLREAAHGLERALTVAADVADAVAMQAVFHRAASTFGAVDGLVNNAGAHHRGPLTTRTPEEVAQMVDVNLRAPLVLTRMVLPGMVARGRGFVVHVASLAGKLPLPGAATYSATKFGLRAFSYAVAQELAGTGVTSSVVSPGPIATDFILSDLDQVEDVVFSQTMCTAEDVAAMVVACARDGRLEREFPVGGGKLATLGYLWPGLRRRLLPVMQAKGRRVKARLRAEQGG